MVAVKTRVACTLFFLSWLDAGWVDGAAAAKPVADTQDPEPALPHSSGFNVYPAQLQNNAVLIYIDQRGINGGKRYLIEPYIYPDWATYSKAVQEICADQPANQFVSVDLEFQTASRAVNEEIVSELKRLLPTETITLATLHSYPYATMYLATGGLPGIDLKTRWRYPSVPPDLLGNAFSNTIGFNTASQVATIEDTCEQLSLIAKAHRKVITAYMYFKNHDIKVDSISASYSSFLRHDSFRTILTFEGSEGATSAIMRGRSSGVGLNFGGIFGGGSEAKQVATTTDTRRRAVTANLIQDAASDFARSFVITHRREIAQDGIEPEEIPKVIADFVLAASQTATATFEKENEQWKVTIGKVVDRTLSQAEVDDLLKSSGDPNLTGANENSAKVSVEGVPVEGSSKQNSTYTDARKIEWKHTGREWIPTSAKLYLISQNELADSATATFNEVLVKKQSALVAKQLTVINTGTPPDPTISYAPDKIVIPILGGAYKTQGYWAGQWHRFNYCRGYAEILPKEGFTVVGGEPTKVVSPPKLRDADFERKLAQSRACRDTGWCDGGKGEKCRTHYRAHGCYVTSQWLDWYRYKQQREKLPENQAEICAEPKAPRAIPVSAITG